MSTSFISFPLDAIGRAKHAVQEPGLRDHNTIDGYSAALVARLAQVGVVLVLDWMVIDLVSKQHAHGRLYRRTEDEESCVACEEEQRGRVWLADMCSRVCVLAATPCPCVQVSVDPALRFFRHDRKEINVPELY
jgi:predicted metal-dependent phosphoesterase TrpH